MVLVSVLTLAMFASGCVSFRACDDGWWGEDKATHFAGAAVLGAATTAAADAAGADNAAPFVGVACAFGFGAGKEYYDLARKKTCWSWRDFAWDVIGGAVGSLLASTVEW